MNPEINPTARALENGTVDSRVTAIIKVIPIKRMGWNSSKMSGNWVNMKAPRR
jgi:hypothetical protein